MLSKIPSTALSIILSPMPLPEPDEGESCRDELELSSWRDDLGSETVFAGTVFAGTTFSGTVLDGAVTGPLGYTAGLLDAKPAPGRS